MATKIYPVAITLVGDSFRSVFVDSTLSRPSIVFDRLVFASCHMLEAVSSSSDGVVGSVSSYLQLGTKDVLVGTTVRSSVWARDSTNSFTIVSPFEEKRVDL